MLRAKSEVRSRESRARMEVLVRDDGDGDDDGDDGDDSDVDGNDGDDDGHDGDDDDDPYNHHYSGDPIKPNQAQERAAMRDAIRATSSGPPPTSARFAFSNSNFLVCDDEDSDERDDNDDGEVGQRATASYFLLLQCCSLSLQIVHNNLK